MNVRKGNVIVSDGFVKYILFDCLPRPSFSISRICSGTLEIKS